MSVRDDEVFTQRQDWIGMWKGSCALVLFLEAIILLLGVLAHLLLENFSYWNLCPFFCNLKVTIESRSKVDASGSGLETYLVKIFSLNPMH